MPEETPVGINMQDSSRHRVRVLLVDDQALIIEAIRRMLVGQPDIEFHFVIDGSRAYAAAAEMRPTVILQDLIMPGSDGFELIRQYRTDASLRSVPVIVLSAKEDPKLKAHSFAVGANDYLVKLPDPVELLARIRYHSAAYISRLERDEAFRFLRESQQKLADANLQLQKLAALDGLTGIGNRRAFDDTVVREWHRGQRSKKPLSMLLCDVDHFKLYNDEFGHQAGDLCLKKVAAVLTEQLKRPADIAARYGGEEFAIVLPETSLDGALKLAEACRGRLENLALDHPETNAGVVTMSIGVASLVPTPQHSPADLIASADRALYDAKAVGRNCVRQA